MNTPDTILIPAAGAWALLLFIVVGGIAVVLWEQSQPEPEAPILQAERGCADGCLLICIVIAVIVALPFLL